VFNSAHSVAAAAMAEDHAQAGRRPAMPVSPNPPTSSMPSSKPSIPKTAKMAQHRSIGIAGRLARAGRNRPGGADKHGK
jgi:hypothetical protein